jgi:hypothetical protein
MGTAVKGTCNKILFLKTEEILFRFMQFNILLCTCYIQHTHKRGKITLSRACSKSYVSKFCPYVKMVSYLSHQEYELFKVPGLKGILK